MIRVEEFYNLLIENEINFFTGVPDSLLKSFCAYIKDNVDNNHNIIAANEGNALALASGYHLATGKTGMVYMQNSGIGNVVNPLASLNDSLVYSIPALLMIGWRGEPGKKDEPQHKKQGKVTLEILETMGVKYSVLSQDSDIEDTKKILSEAIKHIHEKSEPYAIVIKKDTFEEYKSIKEVKTGFELSREEAIEAILNNIGNNDVIVSTTGMASREVFELREKLNQTHEKDFLTVGSMGHASQIALGIAMEKKDKNIYCIDGDGAFIMHMGGIAIIGSSGVSNFKHIIINNGVHDSVGGQPTVGFDIDAGKIALACGYTMTFSVDTVDGLIDAVKMLKNEEGPCLLEVKVNKGARKDLGRPTTTPVQNKEAFMNFLSK